MPRKRIKVVVRRLLNRPGAEKPPPIDVEEVATHLGIEVVERSSFELGGSDEEVSGLLLRADGRTICFVNRDHHRNRKRFSLAHEIGHFLLHPFQESYVDRRFDFRDKGSPGGTNLQEIEANAFAAELLMPEGLMREEIPVPLNVVEDEENVRSLARRFWVSPEAMTHRLIKLDLLRDW